MSENRASSRGAYQGNWETPWKHMDIIKESFFFSLDVCASAENTKCDEWIDEEQDGLITPWRVTEGCYWWCNPDFRKAAEFLEKAYTEMHRGNPGIMLLPPNCEAKWFRKGVTERGIRILFYPQRINFIDPVKDKNKKPSGNNKGSVLAAFTLQEKLPRVAGQPWWSTV